MLIVAGSGLSTIRAFGEGLVLNAYEPIDRTVSAVVIVLILLTLWNARSIMFSDVMRMSGSSLPAINSE